MADGGVCLFPWNEGCFAKFGDAGQGAGVGEKGEDGGEWVGDLSGVDE